MTYFDELDCKIKELLEVATRICDLQGMKQSADM